MDVILFANICCKDIEGGSSKKAWTGLDNGQPPGDDALYQWPWLHPNPQNFWAKALPGVWGTGSDLHWIVRLSTVPQALCSAWVSGCLASGLLLYQFKMFWVYCLSPSTFQIELWLYPNGHSFCMPLQLLCMYPHSVLFLQALLRKTA